GVGSGSGFVVEKWVLTAGHVVINKDTRKYRSPILVMISTGRESIEFLAVPETVPEDALRYDFALLRLLDPITKTPLTDKQTETLPSLQLGNDQEVSVGS